MNSGNVVVIGYDGSDAAERAIREAGGLLSGRPALVVVVWKAGLGWELVELPTTSIGLPPASIDVRTVVEIDQAMAERAQKLAEQGARVARDAGFKADGLAVAEDVETPIAETDVARRDTPGRLPGRGRARALAPRVARMTRSARSRPTPRSCSTSVTGLLVVHAVVHGGPMGRVPGSASAPWGRPSGLVRRAPLARSR